MEKKINKTGIVLGILLMSLTITANNAFSPILSEIGKSFPEASDSSVQIVLTMISLSTFPMMLIEPNFEKFMTKRDVSILGTFLMLVGGILPHFFHSHLWMLYLISILIGSGLSMVVVTSSSLIADYFTGIEKSKIMGYQAIFASLGGAIIAKGSGVLTSNLGWENGYLILLITIPILVVMFTCIPKGEIPQKSNDNEKFHLTGKLIYFGILCFLAGIFISTFNTNIAMYLDRNHIGNQNTAGTVSAIMQVVGIISGLIFGIMVKTFKRFTLGIAVLLTAIGTLLVGLSSSIVMICIGAVFMGIGFAMRNAGGVSFAANMVSAAQASSAIAIVSASFNLGCFVSAYVINPLSSMFGEAIELRFIISGIALLIIGIVTCLKSPITDKQAIDA